MTDAPYPMPGKCEGQSTNPKWVGRVPGSPPRYMRCQRPPTHWSDAKYAWLCDQHDRGWKKR